MSNQSDHTGMMSVGHCNYLIGKGREDYNKQVYNPPANEHEKFWYDFGYSNPAVSS